MTLPLLALASSGALTVMMLVLVIARVAGSERILIQARIARIDPGDPGSGIAESGLAPTGLWRERPAVLDQVEPIIRRLLGTGARRELERAGIRISPSDFFALRIILVLAISASLAVIARTASLSLSLPVLLGVGAAVGVVGPAIYLRWRIARRAKQIERQLSELCEVMSTMLSSGFGYMQALSTAADQIGRPLGEEVHRFLDAVRMGSDFDRALADMRDRLASEDFEVVATALEVQRRTGGNLAEILRGVGITIRERQAFQQELRALTSRERFSAVIIAVFPLLLVSVLGLMLPEVFGRLVTEPIGRVILSIAIGMDLLGYAMARRLAKLEV